MSMIEQDDLLMSSPLMGKVISLKEVDDSVFAQELLGKGVAIKPENGLLIAPFDGTVAMLFNTKHAIGLESETGIELLIHIGIDTVNLEGRHFYPKVGSGEKFKKGDVLMEFDIAEIQNEGYDTTTPIIVTNMDRFDVTIIDEEAINKESNYIFYIQKKE